MLFFAICGRALRVKGLGKATVETHRNIKFSSLGAEYWIASTGQMDSFLCGRHKALPLAV